MKTKLLLLLTVIFSTMGFTQTVVLNEGFDDITTLSGAGWQITNQSAPIGTTTWFQGGSGTNFPGQTGGQTSYIAANFNSTAGTGIISNWLITPTQSLKNGDQLKFWTRVPTGGNVFPDRLEVRSSTGTMTIPSGGPSGVGSFTKVELIINDALGTTYPEVWTEYTITVAGVGATPVPMNFAFRYNIPTSAGPLGDNSNFIGIDTVSITTIAPPSLLTVDLSVANQITLTAATGLSTGTRSGATFDGFYLKDLFSNAGTVTVPVNPGYSGTPTFTAASVPTNNVPKMFRNGGTDLGLNVYGYSATATSTFTTGVQAFTGSVTWTVTAAVYNAALTAPDAGGDVYFPADSSGMLGTATLIGKYTVVKPGATAGTANVNKNNISVYPNPFADILKVSDVKNVKSILVSDASGRKVTTLKPAEELNLSSLSPGIYLITLQMNDGSLKTIKAIKK